MGLLWTDCFGRAHTAQASRPADGIGASSPQRRCNWSGRISSHGPSPTVAASASRGRRPPTSDLRVFAGYVAPNTSLFTTYGILVESPPSSLAHRNKRHLSDQDRAKRGERFPIQPRIGLK